MNLNGKKVLVGDDSILARKQLIDTVKGYGEGATFIEAKNGQEAVELYKENSPDICFLDIVMPVMDGVAAVKNIVEFDKQAIVIIVSSVGTQSMLKAAIDAGAKDFIQKPIEKEQVEHVLEAHLEG
ncbi:MAG: response regulator [Lachnospiraceae bacterium]|nr:response regulator [Lachnospiraceae bacterium]MBQ6258479.1 response regulator [Lachnospiraceae bacterium]